MCSGIMIGWWRGREKTDRKTDRLPLDRCPQLDWVVSNSHHPFADITSWTEKETWDWCHRRILRYGFSIVSWDWYLYVACLDKKGGARCADEELWSNEGREMRNRLNGSRVTVDGFPAGSEKVYRSLVQCTPVCWLVDGEGEDWSNGRSTFSE